MVTGFIGAKQQCARTLDAENVGIDVTPSLMRVVNARLRAAVIDAKIVRESKRKSAKSRPRSSEFVFGQMELLYNLTLEGSKFVKLDKSNLGRPP